MTDNSTPTVETRKVCPACGHIEGAHLDRCRIAELELALSRYEQAGKRLPEEPYPRWQHDVQACIVEYVDALRAAAVGSKWIPSDKEPPPSWLCAEIASDANALFYGKRLRDGKWFYIRLPSLPEPPHD